MGMDANCLVYGDIAHAESFGAVHSKASACQTADALSEKCGRCSRSPVNIDHINTSDESDCPQNASDDLLLYVGCHVLTY